MPQYTFSSTRPDELLYGRSLPYMWMGELGVKTLDKTSPDVLEKLHADFGSSHVDKILAEAPHVSSPTLDAYLTATAWTPCDLHAYSAAITTDQAKIDSFFEAYFFSTPPVIRVHLTKIGRGGSYHPVGQHWLSQQVPAISVRPDCRKEQPLHVIVHETVHLAINTVVDSVFKGQHTYPIKEAIVDQVLSSQAGQSLVGESKPRERFLKSLPQDWQKLSCFKAPLY